MVRCALQSNGHEGRVERGERGRNCPGAHQGSAARLPAVLTNLASAVVLQSLQSAPPACPHLPVHLWAVIARHALAAADGPVAALKAAATLLAVSHDVSLRVCNYVSVSLPAAWFQPMQPA